jgi:tetratricopeptide (TPR) repeat protein
MRSRYWIGGPTFERGFERAVSEFQTLMEMNPRSPWVGPSYLKMGDAYYNLKRYGTAVQAYQKVVKEFPKSREAPEADFGIFLSLQQEKRHDPFVAQGETFVKRYPQHSLTSQVLLILGEYFSQNQMKEKVLGRPTGSCSTLSRQRRGGRGATPHCPAPETGPEMERGGGRTGEVPKKSSQEPSHGGNTD